MSLKRYFFSLFVSCFVLVGSIPGASATFQMLVGTASSPVLIAHVGFQGNHTGGTTSAITTTGATFIIMTGAGYGPFIPAVISDSYGNTWTTPVGVGDTTDMAAWYSICYSPTVGSGHTFTIARGPVNDPFSSFEVAAFSGIYTSSINASSGARSGVGTPLVTTAQAGSITASVAHSLTIALLGYTDNGAISIDSGYTITDTQTNVGGENYGSSMAYLISSSAVAQNPTWTAGVAQSYLSAGLLIFAY